MGGVFNTVNLHTYHYAGNNPVRYTDPDGRKLRLAYNSSDNFKKNYNEAMSYLMHSRTARGIINILHGDSRIVEIEFSPISSTINFERTRISWNPKLGLVPGKGGIISPAVALFHEIAHGFLKTDEGKAIFEKWLNEAKAMNSNSDYTDLDWEEEFVTMLERTVGLELGEKSYREKYNDVQMEAIVQSPTFHSNPPEE
jgi:hypothetical protein